MADSAMVGHLMSTETRKSLSNWVPLGLIVAAVAALIGSLLWRGGASLGFVVAFVILLPAAVASALMCWWPGGREAREACRDQRRRRHLVMISVGLLVSAVITLLLGVLWSGTRPGNTLLIAGILLLPPAILLMLMVWLSGRSIELRTRLEPDEKLVHEASGHWAVFLLPLLVITVTGILALGPFGVVGLAVAGTLYVIVLPGTAVMSLGRFINSAIVITDQRVLVGYGLLRQKTSSVERKRLTATGVKQHAIGKLLGYGKLTLVDRDGNSRIIPGLRRPRRIAKHLE
jgi:hypothetical protein